MTSGSRSWRVSEYNIRSRFFTWDDDLAGRLPGILDERKYPPIAKYLTEEEAIALCDLLNSANGQKP